jgi:hypothetical protein
MCKGGRALLRQCTCNMSKDECKKERKSVIRGRTIVVRVRVACGRERHVLFEVCVGR